MTHDAFWFRNICRRNGFEINDDQIKILEMYVAELLAWNKKINLISRRDEATIWLRHILPSVSILFRFRFESRTSMLDLGTGGGLPGIPLAILLSQVRVTLLDSITKKVTAVRHILEALQLMNISTLTGRAEEIGTLPEHRNKFDYVICRAVGPVLDLVKWSAPFLATANTQTQSGEGQVSAIVPGSLIMLKGGELDLQIEQASRKFPGVEFATIPLVVDGIEPGVLPDKKLIFATMVHHAEKR